MTLTMRLMRRKTLKLWAWAKAEWRWRRVMLYNLLPMSVTLDGRDGTVTLSRSVLAAVTVACERDAQLKKVHMFKVHVHDDGRPHYGFAVDPSGLRGVKANYYEVQYNSQERCAGFAPTCPTVAMMLSDYDMWTRYVARLHVRVIRVHGLIVFDIMRKEVIDGI